WRLLRASRSKNEDRVGRMVICARFRKPSAVSFMMKTSRLTVRFVFFCGRKTHRLVRIARAPGARLLLAALQIVPQRLRQPLGPKLRFRPDLPAFRVVLPAHVPSHTENASAKKAPPISDLLR